MSTITNSNLQLAVDFNGVLGNAKEATRLWLELITGLIIPPSFFAGKSDTDKTVFCHPERHSLDRPFSKAEWSAAKIQLYDPLWFCTYMRPLPQASEVLNELVRLGWVVNLVSTCPGLIKVPLWEWLGRCHLPVTNISLRVEKKDSLYGDMVAVIDNEHRHLEGVDPSVHRILLGSPTAHQDSSIVTVPDWANVLPVLDQLAA